MKDGILRVGAVTPICRVADTEYNGKVAFDAAKEAVALGVKVLVFPELSITSYTCGDLFLQNTLLQSAEKELEKYIENTKEYDLISFLGVPVLFRDKIYNCAAAVSRGRLLGLYTKTYLPDYNEFYESRHFSAAPECNLYINYAGQDTVIGKRIIFECDTMPMLKISAEICEDLWASVPPSHDHSSNGATLIVNLSASNEVVGKASYRKSLVAMQSAKTMCGYVYVSCGEGESGTDMVFGAHNIIAESGKIVAEDGPFGKGGIVYGEIDLEKLISERRRINTFRTELKEGYEYVGFDLNVTETKISNPPAKNPFLPTNVDERVENCELILNIQSRALAARLERSHSKALVIGVSGGLDSTLALIVCAKALELAGRPKSDLIAITMPCFGTTVRTKSNAEKLSEALGASFRTVDIKAAVSQHFKDIGHDDENYNTVYENAQARERTQVLMDIANQVGGLVVGTGDLSEVALGWSTYNGDHMSMYAVNSSVPKTLVRYLTEYVCDKARDMGKDNIASVLRDILDTPVSPELLPPDENGEIQQTTETLVGPYELHDYFLYYFIKYGFTPKKILRLACESFKGVYDKATVKHWLALFLRRFFTQQFKRSCMPDGPKVGSVVLSPRADWRMPSDAQFAAWIASLEEI